MSESVNCVRIPSELNSLNDPIQLHDTSNGGAVNPICTYSSDQSYQLSDIISCDDQETYSGEMHNDIRNMS